LKNKEEILLLAVVLATAAPAFADNISGQSEFGNSHVAFSEGLTEQQEVKGSSARCSFLLDSVSQNGAKTYSIIRTSFSEFTRSDKRFNLGELQNAGMESDSGHVKLVDFDWGASPAKGKDKGHKRYDGGDGEGNTMGNGSGTLSPVILAAEPGEQTLLLCGLAGLGMLCYRRKILRNGS
jgi:hypothetical protein